MGGSISCCYVIELDGSKKYVWLSTRIEYSSCIKRKWISGDCISDHFAEWQFRNFLPRMDALLLTEFHHLRHIFYVVRLLRQLQLCAGRFRSPHYAAFENFGLRAHLVGHPAILRSATLTHKEFLLALAALYAVSQWWAGSR